MLKPFLFNIVLEVVTRAIRQENEVKVIQIGKEEVNLSLFADDIILYIENPNIFTEKLLELGNEFSRIVGYIVNIQKSIVFPYSSKVQTQTKITGKII